MCFPNSQYESKVPLPHSVPVFVFIDFRGIMLSELIWGCSNPIKMEPLPDGQVTGKHRGNTWEQEV